MPYTRRQEVTKLKSVLSVTLVLLMVTVPVFGSFTQTPATTASQEQREDQLLACPFQQIEKQGGKEVDDEKLGEEEGEGFFTWAGGTLVGAIGGTVTGIGVYGVSNWGHWSMRGLAHAAGVGAAAGAGWGATVGYFIPWF